MVLVIEILSGLFCIVFGIQQIICAHKEQHKTKRYLSDFLIKVQYTLGIFLSIFGVCICVYGVEIIYNQIYLSLYTKMW